MHMTRIRFAARLEQDGFCIDYMQNERMLLDADAEMFEHITCRIADDPERQIQFDQALFLMGKHPAQAAKVIQGIIKETIEQFAKEAAHEILEMKEFYFKEME